MYLSEGYTYGRAFDHSSLQNVIFKQSVYADDETKRQILFIYNGEENSKVLPDMTHGKTKFLMGQEDAFTSDKGTVKDLKILNLGCYTGT